MKTLPHQLPKNSNLQNFAITPNDKAMPAFGGITADSRRVKYGDIFFCMESPATDTTQYIENAVNNGAVAIICPINSNVNNTKIPIFYAQSVRRSFSLFCRYLYPQQPKNIVAVTGTNGKTSVAHFCHYLWQLLGYKSATIGTLGLQLRFDFTPSDSLTTPDPLTLHQQLQKLYDENFDCVAIEASSHGLDQHRIDAITLMAAAWTNFTQDHLDYHKTFQAYFDAKSRLLLELLPTNATAVIGETLPPHLITSCKQRKLNVIRIGEDLIIRNLLATANGLQMTLQYHDDCHDIKLPLFGLFQAENVAISVGLLIGCGIAFNDIVTVLPKLRGVIGRMECVHDGDFSVFVDYAHTPDALEKCLLNLRHHTNNKLIVVFGCGGNRDTGKRAIMGDIAHRLADMVYVTDDNPRFENAVNIRRAIIEKCPNAIEIEDRAQAITTALKSAQSGDIVIIAGKGHERGQIINEQTIPFSDHDVIRGFFNDTME